jgi:NTE family protein
MAGQRVDLVLEGGGIKGIGLAGALSVLERNGFGAQNLAGASAGAIIAALYAVGYTAEDLHQLVLTLDFRRFQDGGWDRRIPGGATVGILRRQGLNRGRVFLDWLTRMLAAKGVITFGDLERLFPGESDDRVFDHRLQIIISDLSTRDLLVLPRDAKRLGIDPDRLPVALAVRASMSVPFVFEPVRIDNPETGLQHVLVDGGILSNFPVWLFDCESGNPVRPTLGLRLVEPEPKKPLGAALGDHVAPPAGVRALVDHGKSLLLTMLEAHDRLYLEEADYARTIPIPTLGVQAVQFDLPDARLSELYQSGAKAAESFLETWDFGAYIAAFRRRDPGSRREKVAKEMHAARAAEGT